MTAQGAIGRGAGAVKDRSGHGNHGTAVGAVPTPHGKFGNGASFTNETGFITIGTPLGSTNTSVSLWYYYGGRNPGRDWNVLLSCSNSHPFHLAVFKTGELGAYCGDPLLSGAFLASSRWYHLVKVIDGTRHTLYVNGTVEQDGDSFRNSRNPFGAIGNYGGGYYGALGVIDDVRVWDRPLSEAEVVALYRSGR